MTSRNRRVWGRTALTALLVGITIAFGANTAAAGQQRSDDTTSLTQPAPKTSGWVTTLKRSW